MALITRCPDCAATFRVTPLHLQAHGGEVRCGHCKKIFNGFATLATLQEPEALDLSKAGVAIRPETSPEAPSVGDLPEPALSDPKALHPAPDREIVTPEVTAEAAAREARSSEPPAARKASNSDPQEAKKSSGQTAGATAAPRNYARENYAAEDNAWESQEAESDAFNPVPSREAYVGWGFANLFLLLVLAGQAIYFYRADLAVIAPAAKPYLEEFCELLECTIPLPQNAALMSIESSEMQADVQRPGVVTLLATIRNHASYPQAFPLLELTLTDPRDQPLASHIFTPEAYLGENMDPAGAVAPDHEFNVKVRLDSGDLNAAGYRLFMFYPRA